MVSLGQVRRILLSTVYPTAFAGIAVAILLFYIVCIPVYDTIEMDLPHARSAEIIQFTEPVVDVVVRGDGTVELLWKDVAIPDLAQRLRGQQYVPGVTWVVVAADRRVSYGKVKAVLGELAEARVQRITLRTSKFPTEAVSP